MNLTRRVKSTSSDTASAVSPETEPEPVPAGGTATKGRPTPKRRDSRGARGPVTAPRTRKEAYARQREQAKSDRVQASSAPAGSAAERRAALRRGDASALPRRDQGVTRKLARDYVDSRRMLSNYLLWLFPIMILSTFVRGLQIVQIVVLALFLVLLVEWYVTGRRIIAMAAARGSDRKEGGPMTIGFYAGSRAYLPRKWRLPAPVVSVGDDI